MVLGQELAGDENIGTGIKYAIVSGDGDIIEKSKLLWSASGNAPVLLSSDCQPIEAGGRVVWYINSDGGRTFYSIDVTEKGGALSSEEAPAAAQEPVENLQKQESQEDKKIITEGEGI